MKIVEYCVDGGRSRVGAVVADGVADLTARLPDKAQSLHHLLQHEDWRAITLPHAAADADVGLDDITYEPLAVAGGRVFAIGLNYEKKYPAGKEPPRAKWPPWFTKIPGTLVGHNQPILEPEASDTFDYEVELTAILQSGGRHIPAERALDHVAGWTCMNDGSVREWQRHSLAAGKNFHHSGGIGPWMVTSDEIPDPQDLRLSTRVDGEVRQDASTAAMLFSVAEIISYLSRSVELLPGDIIATGSPEGSGGAYDPPLFLHAGQVIEVEITGIGVLRNPVIDEAVADG